MIKIYIIIICLICNCFAQDYNPCKDKRFLFLTKIELDDMSDRQYNYFIKKEEECSKYRARNSRNRIKSKNIKKNKKNIKKNKKYLESAKINSYTASVYSSLPLFRLNMVSNFDQASINGFKLETPIPFEIGRSIAYLKFELRNYSFSNNSSGNQEFGGNAVLVGFSLPINFFKTKSNWFHPEFSLSAGKFHFSKGLLFGFDIPHRLPSITPFKIKYSLMTNIVQSGKNSGTGWWDLSFNLGYSFKNLIKE
tara:strand:- start:386 stop:1138 length:753 start_codon:yes stop_codon:yes gene_type:complete